jgi:hypothetical protein
MQPINYMLDVQSPVQMALGGYNTALDQASTRQSMQFANTQEARAAETFEMQKQATLESQRAAAAERQAAIEAQERGNAAMMRLIDLGKNATTKDYLIAIAQNPTYKESLGTVFETFGDERRSGEISFGTKLFSALSSNPNIARNLIEERRLAAEESGDRETADTMKSFEMMLEQEGGADVLKATVGTTLAGVMGGSEFKATMEALGIPDGTGNFDQEQKIRKEYTDRTKEFTTVQQAYDRITASQDTGPGDIALVFNYMKMLDPGSTVREGEFSTASNSGGVSAAIRNTYNSLVNGQRLTADQRGSFKSQASDLLGAARQTEQRVRQDLMPVIEEYGLDPARVFGTVGLGQPPEDENTEGAGAEVPPSSAPGAQGVAPPQSFVTSQRVIDAARQATQETGVEVTPADIWQQMSPEQRAQYGG